MTVSRVPTSLPRVHPLPGAGPAVADEPLLIDLLAYIEENIGEPELGTESLLAAFHLSRATLYRLFQSRGGVASYIREQRLRTAHRYLQLHPECSLTWLLYEMGFASERQFQRAFQARFGMSPAHWRKACRAMPHPPKEERRGPYIPMWRIIRELCRTSMVDDAPVYAAAEPATAQ
ncbi:helix-turn-helix transcriptional regulator [Xanthomonas sp. AmX2]|nr:AraC family transcriptional regulator [Xanthomonas sp.]MBN6149165.1 helix-turn-helix transcriptional regulator [Xanthomonas sp.]